MDPNDITPERLEELIKLSEEQDKPLGIHPVEGLPVFMLSGRYGPYVQYRKLQKKIKSQSVYHF